MANLVPTLTAEIADPISVFGIETVHDASYTDRMHDLARRNPPMTGLRYDDALGCLMLTPAYKGMNTLLADATVDGVLGGNDGWKQATTRTGIFAVQQTGCVRDTEWNYTSGTSATTAIPDGGGMWITLGKSAPVMSAPTTHGRTSFATTTIDPQHCYVAARLCMTSQIMYRIMWRYTAAPCLERTTDAGANWIWVGDIPVGDISQSAHGMPDLLRFQILRANGRIAFRATASNAVDETALTIADDLEFNMPLEITGMNVQCSIMHFPVTFGDGGTIQTDPRLKMWANDNEATVAAVGSHITDWDAQNAPDGISLVMVDTGSNATTSYLATFAAQGDDNTVSPYLTYVHVTIPGTRIAPDPNPVWFSLPYVLGFGLDSAFVREQPSVRRSGDITTRNNPQGTGNGNNGLYSEAYGMRAVRVTAGLDLISDDGLTRETLWSDVRFIGWLGAHSTCSPWEWTSSLTDRIGWELDQPVLADVQFDAACIYWTARQLAERAGFQQPHYAPVTDLDGTDITDAWTCDGVTCDPAHHTRLGQGTVTNPSFAYTASDTIWDILCDIAIKYGMFVGVTSDGRFEFCPFSMQGARDNFNPKQVFSSIPEGNGRIPYLNEFIGRLVKHVDLSCVRNSVTLIGADKNQNLIASHQIDEASIIGNGTPNPPVNFLGRMRSYVDCSPRYYDPAATDVWCQAKFNIMRQPRIWYDPMDVWALPLFPLDPIGIAANWTLPGDDCFYIASMSERITTSDDGIFQVYNMTLNPELIPY